MKPFPDYVTLYHWARVNADGPISVLIANALTAQHFTLLGVTVPR